MPEKTQRNLVFTGFASCGKTATGMQAAKLLGYTFYDLDEAMEKRFTVEEGIKKRCRDIYALKGLDYFKELETRALRDLLVIKSAVLSTGGGAAVSDANRPLLKEFGIVVYLYASPEDILVRMLGKGYPAYLSEDPSIDNLRYYWDIRHPLYSSLADITIDTTGKDIQTVTAEVLKSYE